MLSIRLSQRSSVCYLSFLPASPSVLPLLFSPELKPLPHSPFPVHNIKLIKCFLLNPSLEYVVPFPPMIPFYFPGFSGYFRSHIHI